MIMLLVVFSFIIGSYSYQTYKEERTSNYAHEALAIANTLASAIDGDELGSIADVDRLSEFWAEVGKIFDETADSAGAKFIYAIVPDSDGKYRFFSSSRYDEAETGFKQNERVFTGKIDEVLQRGQPVASGIYFASSDQHGNGSHFISGFAPIYASNKKRCRRGRSRFKCGCSL